MGEMFTFFSITGLINAIVSLAFALYLAVTSWNIRLARYLVYLCLALGAWSTGYFLWQISITHDSALFWSRVLMAGAIFTSISFLHLVVVFLGYERQRFYRWMLILFYIPCFFWEALNFTPYFVAGVEQRMFFKFWPIPGFFLPFQVLLFCTHVIIASLLLYKKYKKSSGIEKKQTLMLLIGITTTFVSGSTNYFLWFNIPIAPWGNGLASAYAVLSVYAIMKYGLLNTKVVLAEISAGSLVLFAFSNTLLARGESEFIYSAFVFLGVTFFGMMLVRSVRQEVRRREEVTKLARSLEQANFRLQEVDRQKTEFLSIASHQLRTPLSILKGYIELIKDGAYGKPSKKLLHTLHDMDESNERLVKLVDDFLDISRIEQGRTKFSFADKDIKELVMGVVHELSDRAKAANLAIKYKPSAKSLLVNMDDEKVRHVVFNYVDNAIKYCGTKKGEIEVRIDEDEEGVSVRVIDRGIGFSKKDEANFFQKFYRGENVKTTNVNGTGLGLFVCRMFVENHQGRVWAHSEGVGSGSEFGFWLPKKRPAGKQGGSLNTSFGAIFGRPVTAE